MGKSKVSNRRFDSKEPLQKMDDTIKESSTRNFQTLRKPSRELTSYLIIAGIMGAFAFCVFAIFCNHQTPTQETIEIKEIKEIKAKKEIVVHPGEKEDLGLVIEPKEADWKGLKFKIYNEDIVDITDDWCVVGLDGLGGKDSDQTTILIQSGEAEPAIIIVTVERQGTGDNNHILDEILKLDLPVE